MKMGIVGSNKRFFIAGTDTGVGKTYFACRMARHLADCGEKVGIFKPIETGVLAGKKSDGFLLKEAAFSKLPIEIISPYRFKTPAAPRVASLNEKRTISIRKIWCRFQELSAKHDWMIVEGAGGLLVPIHKGFHMADLIQSLQLPVILVSLQRLGTINHTLLSIEYAKNHGLNILAVILNQKEKELKDSSFQSNQRMIEENCNIPVLTNQFSASNHREKRFWGKLLG